MLFIRSYSTIWLFASMLLVCQRCPLRLPLRNLLESG